EDITRRKEAELALADLQGTLEHRVRERIAGLEQAVRDLQEEIGRRRQTEAALKASEQRYHALYEHNPTMYFTLTPDGTVLSVNRFGAEELGYRVDELVGQSVLAVFQATDHHTVLEQLIVCSRSPGRTFDWEIQKVRKGGERLWVKERARAITGPDGNPIILIVCEDITEQRRTQALIRDRDQQLQTTTQFLHTLVQESPLPIVSLDAEARVTSWNQAATKLFGWTEEEVLGRELPYVPTGQEAEADALWNHGIHHGIRGPLSLRRQRKDGKLLDLLLWPVFVEDPTGRLSTAVGLYVDQSDLRQAEDARLHSEERLRSFLNALDDLAFEFDEHGAYLNVWTRNEDILLLPKEEAVGKTLADLHGREAGERHHHILTRVLSSGQPETIEYSLTIHGQPRHFSAILSRIPASANTPSTVACVVRDITDRKQAELALRLSEERFEIAFRSSPHPVVITELATGRCLEVNDTALQLFGFQRHEAVGRTTIAIELWPKPEDRTRFVTQLLETGTLRGVEFTFQTKDHRLRHCLVSSELIELNGTRCILTVGTDVTERKEAEAALRESEERWQRFVADAPVGLVVAAADKRILSANKAFCALTGYSEQEVINNTYALYTHPDDLPGNLQLTEEFFSGQRDEYTYEKRYVRKDGEIIWVSIRASRLAVHGYDTPLLLAVVEDITDRKQALAERERISQDLHDNILQSLYAVGMQLEAGKLLTGKAPRKSKQHVTQAIRQLNHLVLEVRQFITGLTRRAAPSLDFSVAFKQLVASFSSDHHAAPALNIDPQVLAAITPAVGEQLLNITREALSNSVRHAAAAHRSVALTATDTHVHLRIADDGMGFDTTRKRRRGQGLANMAARARTIRAQFTLESTPGRGTCITIDVPTGGPHVH
ncbi:MAG TPA: PAS domain S-box protein, partial [Nitrospira sp.]